MPIYPKIQGTDFEISRFLVFPAAQGISLCSIFYSLGIFQSSSNSVCREFVSYQRCVPIYSKIQGTDFEEFRFLVFAAVFEAIFRYLTALGYFNRAEIRFVGSSYRIKGVCQFIRKFKELILRIFDF